MPKINQMIERKPTAARGDLLIAGFMGLDPFINRLNETKAEEIAYHKSWAKLMPVVEKIVHLEDGNKIDIHYGTGATDSFSWMEIKYWDVVDGEKTIKTPYWGDEDGSKSLLYTIWKTVLEFIAVWCVDRRIGVYIAGYPEGEARYRTIWEYQKSIRDKNETVNLK